MQPYYQANGVTIYHGGCLPVMAGLPAGEIDLIFTSPPYNLGNTTGGGEPAARIGHYAPGVNMKQRGGGGKWPRASRAGGLAHGYGAQDDSMPHAEYVAWQQDVLRACWRVLAPAGAIFYNHKVRILDGQAIFPLSYVPPELLPHVRQEIIWARAGGVNFSPAFYLPTHERILIIARPAWRLKSKGASGVGDVWYVPQEPDPTHPAPFPAALPLRAIETTGARVVCDPFMGRGTTLWAAQQQGAAGIGMDTNAAYCDLAVQNLQAYAPVTRDPQQMMLFAQVPA
jgi:site-specific DNA-methyltransferase (adenine-specific)